MSQEGILGREVLADGVGRYVLFGVWMLCGCGSSVMVVFYISLFRLQTEFL
jgi:hypothetical protein